MTFTFFRMHFAYMYIFKISKFLKIYSSYNILRLHNISYIKISVKLRYFIKFLINNFFLNRNIFLFKHSLASAVYLCLKSRHKLPNAGEILIFLQHT